MPPAACLNDERHKEGARQAMAVLRGKLVFMPLLGSQAWLGSACFPEVGIVAEWGYRADIVGGRPASIRRELHDVQTSIRAHRRIALFDRYVPPSLGQHVRKLADK